MTSDVVVAYHGCDFETAMLVVGDDFSHLTPSKNPYDWLGEGVYFFEADVIRTKKFAQAAASSPHLRLTAQTIRHPYAIGAVIRLGNCLDLSKQTGIDELMHAYAELQRDMPPGHELLVAHPDRSAQCRLYFGLFPSAVAYGRSLPGFESIGCSAVLPGRALANIRLARPLLRWPHKSQQREVYHGKRKTGTGGGR
jgi:hypothetical protein